MVAFWTGHLCLYCFIYIIPIVLCHYGEEILDKGFGKGVDSNPHDDVRSERVDHMHHLIDAHNHHMINVGKGLHIGKRSTGTGFQGGNGEENSTGFQGGNGVGNSTGFGGFGGGNGTGGGGGGAGGPILEGIQQAYQANWKKVWEKAEKDSGSDESSDFTTKVQGCASKLKSCSKEVGPEEGAGCYLRCLLQGNPQLDRMAVAIYNTLFDLCRPLNTIYLQIFKSARSGAGHLKTYPKFLEALGIFPRDFDRAIPQMSNAILVALIKYGKTSLTPLKKVITELESSLEIQAVGQNYLMYNNPECRTLHMYDPAESIAGMLYKDPATSDILIPGFAMFSTVSKYLSSRVTQHMAVLREGARMFVGSAKGISCSAEPPSANANCDDLGRYPIPGFPIPPPVGGASFVSLVNPVCPSEPNTRKEKPKEIFPVLKPPNNTPDDSE